MPTKKSEISEFLTVFGNKQFEGLDELYDKFKGQVKQCFTSCGWKPQDQGVGVIVEQHKKNKSVLRDILSRHPRWSYEDHAVIIPYTNKLVRNDLLKCSELYFAYCQRYVGETINTKTFSKSKFIKQLTTTYQMIKQHSQYMIEGLLTKNAVDAFESLGIKSSVGQKMSRIINKLAGDCPGMQDTQEYRKLYAALSDALSPLEVQCNSILSIHPVDFLLMSHGNSKWSSCHGIRKSDNKDYKSGPISYLQDSTSMIFFTVGNETDDIHRAGRITRQLFHYFQGRMIQSRLYPDWRNTTMATNYRNIVQATMAECLGIPNLWEYTDSLDKIHRLTNQPDESTHYKDYKGAYNQYMMTVKGIQCADTILIGSQPHCIECGEPHSNPKLLTCCELINCSGCSQLLPLKQLTKYGEQTYYCSDCHWTCEHCTQRHPTARRSHPITLEDGSIKNVCDHCLQNHYFRCGSCNRFVANTSRKFLHDSFGGQSKVCNTCYKKYVFKCPECEKDYFSKYKTEDGVCKCCYQQRIRLEEEAKVKEMQRIKKEQEAKERAELLKTEEEKFKTRIPDGMKPVNRCDKCNTKFDCERIEWVAVTIT